MIDEKADDKTLSAQERVKAAGERARAEADARRVSQAAPHDPASAPKEIDGRGGLDPVRYDDWEIKGLTADF